MNPATDSTRDRASARRDAALFALLAIAALAAYLAAQRGQLDSWDGRAMASVGRNLIQHGSLKECCNAFGAYPGEPGPYAKGGVGYSALLAPLWYFQLHSDSNGAVWLGLANALLLAATTVVIAKTGLVLGWRRSSAALAALAFALLTMAPLYSAAYFAEPGVTFATALVLLGLVIWQQRAPSGALLVGIGTAIAVLFRPDSLILIGPIVALMLLIRSRRELAATWRSWLPRLAIPIGGALACTLWYDYLRYGHLLQTGYSGVYDKSGFSTPLLDGIGLLVWSPGKSFFVYSPILLAAVPGLFWLAKRNRPLTVAIVAMFLLRVGFYARWYTPEGGDSWGPRFLLPLCAALAIPFGETLESVHAIKGRARTGIIGVLSALAAASAVVQISSLAVSYRDVFPAIGNVANVPASLRTATLSARVHGYLWSFTGSHIAWNLRHIGSRRVSLPLHWFAGGATAFGVGMLALAGVAVTGAMKLALLSDRIDQRPGRLQREI
jgi:4-amino-4-deoxy-L-arabinose transferase-like glycosyltransferase